MSFTTVEEVALYLNRNLIDFDTLELEQINMLISHVDGMINNYCGWDMIAQDYVDKRFDGSGTNTLDLRLYPVNYITQVRVRADDGTFTDVTDGIEILDDGLIQFLPYASTDYTTFTTGTKNWFISVNAGFHQAIAEVVADAGPPVIEAVAAQASNVPKDLTYAASTLVAQHFNKLIDENIGSEEEQFDGATLKNAPLIITSPVRRMLDRYRMVSIF